MQYARLGIIGAGTMGIGLAVDALLHNKEVMLVDLEWKILKKAQKEIIQFVRYASLADSSIVPPDKEAVEKNLNLTLTLEDLACCNYIVENVYEDEAVKEKVYKQLDQCCPNTLIGANTSCISITKLGSFLHEPERMVGIHFMNPVFLKKTVEMIQGFHTSDDCIQNTQVFLSELGKEAVIVQDSAGFVSNRVSHLYMNEAAFVIQDQVATAKQVDQIFRDCFSHKMGPLETADLIGLDTVVDSLNILYHYYQDPKFRCCPLLKKMVDAGMLGKKSGQGFYKY